MMRVTGVLEDLIILPIALLALAVKILFKVTLSFLIRILDYAFPVLLQVMRFPLFTARIMGDGIMAVLRSAVGLLPVPSTKRDEWRELISRYWSWLRQKISYKAFETAVHHAFEHGKAWVFKRCRTLSPRSALLVIAGAVLWLPVSFGAATVMHAALIAKATSLPAWMQIPLRSYIAHYGDVGRKPEKKFSERVGSFFGRWSIKFSAEYYEARESDEVARRHTRV